MTLPSETALATVISPGLLSCSQDLGRPGFRHIGVSPAGAADLGSYELASLLVGQKPPFAAALEIWQSGLHLEFHSAGRIAIFGGEAEIDCNGYALRCGRPLDLPAGSQLRVIRMSAGNVLYLSVCGGWQAAPCMGSLSTDLRAGFGGFDGRPLRQGDRLLRAGQPAAEPIERAASSPRQPSWWVGPVSVPGDRQRVLLRFVPEANDDQYSQGLIERSWRLGSDSNRQGFRLHGPALASAEVQAADRPSVGTKAGNLLSRAVLPGTIQLPPGGRPIVLGVDAQTIGGYPVIGHVIQADLDLLSQCPPNSMIHFSAVSAEQARRAFEQRRAELARAQLRIEQALQTWDTQGR